VIDVSPGVDRILYSKTCSSGIGYDVYARPLDGTGTPGSECTLAGTATATTFGLPALTDDGKWAVWTDPWDTSVGVGTGKIGNLAACSTGPLNSDTWAWDPVAAKGYVVNDTSNGTEATIRTVDVRSGSAAAPVLVQERAHVTYSLPHPDLEIIVYAMATGDSTDGLYAFGTVLP